MPPIRVICVSLTLPALLCLGTPALSQDAASATPENSVNLNAGDCALFVWSGYPSRLLFISQAETGKVSAAQSGGKTYGLSPNREPDKFGQFPNQDFLTGAGDPWQLRLDNASERPHIVTYRSGTLTLPAPDGWLRIESAQAVSACNNSGADSVILRDKTSGGFAPPVWIERPAEPSDNVSEAEPADVTPPLEPGLAQQVILTPQQPPEPLVMAETATAPRVIIQAPAPPSVGMDDSAWLNANVVTAAPVPAPMSETVPAPVVVPAPRPEPAPIPAPESVLEATAVIPPPSPTLPPTKTSALPFYTVQVGSYLTDALAQKAWIELQEKAAYLNEKERLVQRATVKGDRVYRLRVKGFDGRFEAVEFCWRLQTNGVDCYVPSAR